MIYEIKDFSFSYNKNIPLLKNINFEFKKNDQVFILGLPGVGKTTFLKILKGELKTQLQFDRINQTTFVYEDLFLRDEWYVRDYISMTYAKERFPDKKKFNVWTLEMAGFLEIEHILKLKVSQLNLGAKQLLAILISLLSRPDVLLADAPFANLNENKAQNVIDLFEYYNRHYSLSWIATLPFLDFKYKTKAKILTLENGILIGDDRCSTSSNYLS